MLDNLKAANAKRWAAMTVNANAVSMLDAIARRLVAAKARYKTVEAKTGVPWFVIAVIHEREASQSWNTQLAQGDPLNRVSTHVPRGQGPYTGPDAWERAAIIALEDTGGPKWGDWTPSGTMTFLEKYNGLGYANMGKPSPYVWAKTNQYVRGKYIADGKYSGTAVDTQPGCAALITRMKLLDPSITFGTPMKTTATATVAGAGAVVAAGAAASTGTDPHLWIWILGGTVLAAIATYAVFHLIKGNE